MKEITILFLSFLFHYSTSLKCYTCSLTESEADTKCLDDPAAADDGIKDCDKKYCTIVRIDYKDPRGKLASMTRGCEDIPIHLNDVIEDGTHRSYFRSCRQDLCNGGTGRTETKETQSGSLGDKSTIYCPGTNTNGVGTFSKSVTTIIPTIVIIVLKILRICLIE